MMPLANSSSLRRRRCATLLTGLLVGSCVQVFAQSSQPTYPSRPIRLLVGYPAGGGADSIARVVANKLQAELGQAVIVDNKPGAATLIATSEVIRAAPDGYTLMLHSSDITIGPALRKKLPWSINDDFTFISTVATNPLVYVVNNTVPAKSLGDFVAYAKTKGKALNYGSAGVGSALHLGTAELEAQTGVAMTHVPYRGGAPLLQDLMAGQIEFGSLTAVSVVGREDKIRAIAQTGSTRHPLIPNVPTTAEAGFPKLTPTSFFVLVAPPKLPVEIKDRLAEVLAKVTANSDYRKEMIAAGAESHYLTGPALRTFVAADLKHWQDLSRTANIALED